MLNYDTFFYKSVKKCMINSIKCQIDMGDDFQYNEKRELKNAQVKVALHYHYPIIYCDPNIFLQHVNHLFGN